MNRMRAPDIPPGLDWLGVVPHGGSVRDWQGRAVLLEFWTRSCVNCVHAAAEIDALVAPYGDRVMVIGVHSPKFPAEKALAVVEAGVAQFGFDHPVVNDPELRLWRAYGVQEWPTVVLIGPDGELVSEAVGEGEIAGLAVHLKSLVGAEIPAGSAGPITVERDPDELKFPNRMIRSGADWLVTEQGGDLVRLDSRFAVVARYGGFVDPMGLCWLPDGRVAVADAGRHQVLAVDLDTEAVMVIAGTGRRGARRVRAGAVIAIEADLASPHDVVWWRDRLVIAVAGHHQILAVSQGDPQALIEVVAGSSAEGHKDGSSKRARLAQPTALVADDDRLWFVDADSSSLRYVEDEAVSTVAGKGVLQSGHRDGAADQALFQHPAGLAIDSVGRVLVADVFNGVVRRFDPGDETVVTVAGALGELTDVWADESGVWVLDRLGHEVTQVELAPRIVDGPEHVFEMPVAMVQPSLSLDFVGEGRVEVEVAGEPAELVSEVRPSSGGAELELATQVGEGVLNVVAHRSECDDSCTLMTLSWRLPVVVTAGGMSALPLIGRG